MTAKSMRPAFLEEEELAALSGVTKRIGAKRAERGTERPSAASGAGTRIRQWASCVVWGLGLQSFVGAMRCMELTHTSGLCGGHALHGAHPHIILEL